MGKRRCAIVALSLLLTAQIVAGCGQGRNASQPGGNVSASPSDSPDLPSTGGITPSPSGQPKPTSSYSASKGPVPGEITVRGQVAEGVEAGCLLLNTDDGRSFLLLGGDRGLIGSGGRLEVVGQPQPDLMTTCQQGTPFQVSQVRRI